MSKSWPFIICLLIKSKTPLSWFQPEMCGRAKNLNREFEKMIDFYLDSEASERNFTISYFKIVYKFSIYASIFTKPICLNCRQCPQISPLDTWYSEDPSSWCLTVSLRNSKKNFQGNIKNRNVNMSTLTYKTRSLTPINVDDPFSF